MPAERSALLTSLKQSLQLQFWSDVQFPQPPTMQYATQIESASISPDGALLAVVLSFSTVDDKREVTELREGMTSLAGHNMHFEQAVVIVRPVSADYFSGWSIDPGSQLFIDLDILSQKLFATAAPAPASMVRVPFSYYGGPPTVHWASDKSILILPAELPVCDSTAPSAWLIDLSLGLTRATTRLLRFSHLLPPSWFASDRTVIATPTHNYLVPGKQPLLRLGIRLIVTDRRIAQTTPPVAAGLPPANHSIGAVALADFQGVMAGDKVDLEFTHGSRVLEITAGVRAVVRQPSALESDSAIVTAKGLYLAPMHTQLDREELVMPPIRALSLASLPNGRIAVAGDLTQAEQVWQATLPPHCLEALIPDEEGPAAEIDAHQISIDPYAEDSELGQCCDAPQWGSDYYWPTLAVVSPHQDPNMTAVEHRYALSAEPTAIAVARDGLQWGDNSANVIAVAGADSSVTLFLPHPDMKGQLLAMRRLPLAGVVSRDIDLSVGIGKRAITVCALGGDPGCHMLMVAAVPLRSLTTSNLSLSVVRLDVGAILKAEPTPTLSQPRGLGFTVQAEHHDQGTPATVIEPAEEYEQLPEAVGLKRRRVSSAIEMRVAEIGRVLTLPVDTQPVASCGCRVNCAYEEHHERNDGFFGVFVQLKTCPAHNSLAQLLFPLQGQPLCVSVSDDGRYMVVGSSFSSYWVYNTTTTALVCPPIATGGLPICCSIVECGGRLILCTVSENAIVQVLLIGVGRPARLIAETALISILPVQEIGAGVSVSFQQRGSDAVLFLRSGSSALAAVVRDEELSAWVRLPLLTPTLRVPLDPAIETMAEASVYAHTPCGTQVALAAMTAMELLGPELVPPSIMQVVLGALHNEASGGLVSAFSSNSSTDPLVAQVLERRNSAQQSF